MVTARWTVALVSVCIGVVDYAICADTKDGEPLKSSVLAPPNTRSVGSARGGAYFVDKGLLESYEALRSRLNQVREDITQGAVTGEAAMQMLAGIEADSSRLREEIDRRKVLVAAFQVYSQKSEQVFPLGDSRLVIVTGDNVTLRGWEGPGLKCVVEKIIVANKEPESSAFDEIRLRHELTIAEDKVGLTAEQRDQQEQEFLESDKGRALSEEQKARRRKFIDEVHRSYDRYVAFQGRQANTIQLTGLTFEEGNRNLRFQITSPDGGALHSSQWQRHATMTVFVPPCESVAVRGCLSGLDIEGVECDLVLTRDDSRDREYDGSFVVRNVKGNVRIDQVPVRSLSDVSGDVWITATDEFVNSRTQHENNRRSISSYEPQATRIVSIGGNLQATFLRTNLHLSAVRGVLDVANHYGPTQFEVVDLDAERAHRILSHSGEVTITGPPSVLEKTPIYAFTECGRLRTNLSQEVLEDVNFSTGQPQRGWHGLVTPSNDRFDLGRFERPVAAVSNQDRTPGLDLISHAGMVTILKTEEIQ